MTYSTGETFARRIDQEDELAAFRARFAIPKTKDGRDTIYLCGNSLGAMPLATPKAMQEQLDGWARHGVEGHWTPPCEWLSIHETMTAHAAQIVGAKPPEVVVMGSLTANVHHMMASFYNPTPKRFKILYESNAFPSDRYAIASHIDMVMKKLENFLGKGKAGFTVDEAMIELQPRAGEVTLRMEDIIGTIERQGDEIALILIGGNNFYTGQKFDMARITQKGHEKGCVVGFDLAHSVGNVKLSLHDWGVDFACWCPYKYLNSGPGGVSAIYVHEKHHANPDIPRLMGWWSNKPSTRFQMRHKADPYMSAEVWQMSNPPVFSMIPVRVSLGIFAEAGMDRLIAKSRKLTGYLEYLLDGLDTDAFKILTPRDPEQRGAQLSIVLKKDGKKVFEALERAGIICDWREPDCIRVAPVPLYNSFMDVYNFVQAFAAHIEKAKAA